METFIEILKVILPSCITGLITFWITRYTCQKNISLDKLEVTYNRIYYPIYRMIRNNEGIVQIIEKSEVYFEKYNKYVDRSTTMAFKYLKDNPDNQNAYSNFRDNIYSINCNLRRRLGYLEPNMFSMYTYATPNDKRIFRIIVELFICCVLGEMVLICNHEPLQIILVAIILIILICFLIDIVIGLGKKLCQVINVIIKDKIKK